MPSYPRGTGAVARHRRRLLRQARVPQGSTEGEVQDDYTKPSLEANIVKLPMEVRLMIYGTSSQNLWIMVVMILTRPVDKVAIELIGNRVIHIEGGWERHVNPGWRGIGPFKLSHSICCAKVSSPDTYGAFSTGKEPTELRRDPPAYVDPHSELELLWSPHSKCYDTIQDEFRTRGFPFLNLNVLKWSSETWRRASKLLCSTNTFSFTSLRPLKAWLATVPLRLHSHIHSIRLELMLTGHVT